MWQMPEYFISTSTSSGLSSSMTMGFISKSSPTVSTTRASVSIGNCIFGWMTVDHAGRCSGIPDELRKPVKKIEGNAVFLSNLTPATP